jgi:uncharacterized tellurite resistance protein B-like protein
LLDDIPFVKVTLCLLPGRNQSLRKGVIMRQYRTNSPQAKARIVAIALLADGGLDKVELDVLDQSEIVTRIGITHEQFDTVIHQFCDDLLQYSVRDENGELQLGRETIDAMLDEITEPAAQRTLLRMMIEIVHADHRLSGGEAVLTSQAMNHWDIDLHELAMVSSRAKNGSAGMLDRRIDRGFAAAMLQA